MTDYFAVLGVPRRFCLDGRELERRFYERSRELHPDRFTLQEPQVREKSLEQMSELNEGYRVLKNPTLRRIHCLELEGLLKPAGAGVGEESAKPGRIPLEITESWFELQDSLASEPDSALSRLLAFDKEFREFRDSREEKIESLERQADEGSSSRERDETLAQLAELAREQSYLSSMERDIERIRLRLGS